MKAKMIITAIAITISMNGLMANQSESILTFWNAAGEKLIQPVMVHESDEALPLEVRCEFERMRNGMIHKTFDISELTRPEEEEELPYFIQNIIQS